MIVKNRQVKKESLGAGLSRKILARGGNMMVVEVSFEKGARGSLHKEFR